MSLELDNHAAGRASRRQAIRQAKVAEELEAFVNTNKKQMSRVTLHGFIVATPYSQQPSETQRYAVPHKAYEKKKKGVGEGGLLGAALGYERKDGQDRNNGHDALSMFSTAVHATFRVLQTSRILMSPCMTMYPLPVECRLQKHEHTD